MSSRKGNAYLLEDSLEHRGEPEQMLSMEEKLSKVRSALNNEKYLWRSTHGIKKEADLDTYEVIFLLQQLRMTGEVVQTRGKDGNPVYALTRRFHQNRGFTRRFLTALTGELR